MADIELVIKIDENEYNNLIKRAHENVHALSHVDKMILHGTPIPKGYGRLISANELQKSMEKDIRRAMSFVDLEDFVLLARTIIKEEQK